MQLKKYWPWLIAILIVGVIFLLKTRPTNTQPAASIFAQAAGPAVILFRGDNSASCMAIHRLVDDAEKRYSSKVTFMQFDWSPDNPLIERYQVRFLPTVLFIDYQGKEAGRIIGESPATQAKLKDALAQLDSLLLQ